MLNSVCELGIRYSNCLLRTAIALFAMLSCVGANADYLPENISVTVRNIQVVRSNIFSELAAEQNLVPRLINRFHTKTRESVIRREIWFSRGDSVDNDDLKELERNIRELGLFANVNLAIKLIRKRTPNRNAIVDIRITTADRLSIVASTSGSVLGGVGEVSASFGEKNLFGIAHSIEFGYKENTAGELLASFAYDNVRLGNGDALAGIRVGTTEEGMFGGISIRNEFENTKDDLSWKVELEKIETRIDYYEDGESVAEVPRVTQKISANRFKQKGSRSELWHYGPFAEYKITEYSPAMGEQGDSITVPSNSTEVFLGGSLGRNTLTDTIKVNWLDTLNFVQDVTFGYGVDVALGASLDLDNADDEGKPVVFLNAWWRKQFPAKEFISSSFKSSYVLNENGNDSWSLTTDSAFYSVRFKPFTLASSLKFSAGENGTGLPAEFTLGEDSGLRGYRARALSGSRSLLLNLESRVPTPIKLFTFSLGAVAFVDTGWVENDGVELFDDPHTSVGFGARIGSPKILGSGVFRLDFSFPLHEDIEDESPLVSLSLGQVFTFN